MMATTGVRSPCKIEITPIVTEYIPLRHSCTFEGHDLRTILRSGASDEELMAAISDVWHRRADRYSELRSAATSNLPRIEMFAMGG